MNQQTFTTIRRDSQCAVLEWVDNHLLVIEHDQNYAIFVVSALFYKLGGGEGALFRGDAHISNFGR